FMICEGSVQSDWHGRRPPFNRRDLWNQDFGGGGPEVLEHLVDAAVATAEKTHSALIRIYSAG
ncbi:MAG TPA: hypothetical protein VGX70_01490, partial [Gemmataceae bacterium]|nr:hypothetical protein [Gemmataceae bacterium]